MATDDSELEQLVKNLQIDSIHTGSSTSKTHLEASINVRFSLYAKSYTDKIIRFKTFQNTFLAIWSAYGICKISQVQTNLFLLEFDSSKNVDKVLDESPWTFQNDFVLLERIQQGKPLTSYLFDTLPLWVQVHHLPLDLLCPQIVCNLLDGIGDIQPIDPLAASQWRRYARVRIIFKLPFKLKSEVRSTVIEGQTIQASVRYERLQRCCMVCCELGHEATSCQTRLRILKAIHSNIPDSLRTYLQESIQPKINDTIKASSPMMHSARPDVYMKGAAPLQSAFSDFAANNRSSTVVSPQVCSTSAVPPSDITIMDYVFSTDHNITNASNQLQNVTLSTDATSTNSAGCNHPQLISKWSCQNVQGVPFPGSSRNCAPTSSTLAMITAVPQFVNAGKTHGTEGLSTQTTTSTALSYRANTRTISDVSQGVCHQSIIPNSLIHTSAKHNECVLSDILNVVNNSTLRMESAISGNREVPKNQTLRLKEKARLIKKPALRKSPSVARHYKRKTTQINQAVDSFNLELSDIGANNRLESDVSPADGRCFRLIDKQESLNTTNSGCKIFTGANIRSNTVVSPAVSALTTSGLYADIHNVSTNVIASLSNSGTQPKLEMSLLESSMATDMKVQPIQEKDGRCFRLTGKQESLNTTNSGCKIITGANIRSNTVVSPAVSAPTSTASVCFHTPLCTNMAVPRAITTTCQTELVLSDSDSAKLPCVGQQRIAQQDANITLFGDKTTRQTTTAAVEDVISRHSKLELIKDGRYKVPVPEDGLFQANEAASNLMKEASQIQNSVTTDCKNDTGANIRFQSVVSPTALYHDSGNDKVPCMESILCANLEADIGNRGGKKDSSTVNADFRNLDYISPVPTTLEANTRFHSDVSLSVCARPIFSLNSSDVPTPPNAGVISVTSGENTNYMLPVESINAATTSVPISKRRKRGLQSEERMTCKMKKMKTNMEGCTYSTAELLNCSDSIQVATGLDQLPLDK